MRGLHKSVGGLKAPSVASTSAPNRDRFNVYSSVLDDLKNPKSATTRNGIHSKPFSEINASTYDTIPESERKHVPWSSGFDPVSRSPFAKDIVHLQSLLDALLASKNFDRADKILKAIFPISERVDDFVFSLNQYLEAWSREDVTLADVESYLDDITARFPYVRPNDRTYAILLSKLMNDDSKFTSYLTEAKNAHQLLKIFDHLDMLGVDGLTMIFKQDFIKERDIPADLLPLFHLANAKEDEISTSDETPEYFKKTEQVAPIVEKDAVALRAVDSFGLKVIRHTLLGLQSENNSPVLDDFINNLELELGVNVLHNVNLSKKDYFAVYRSLESDAQREKFNEALGVFNETRQRQLELRGVDGAREKWKHEYEEMQKRGTFALHKNLNVQLFKWYSDMLPYVEKEAEICRKIVLGEINTKDKKQEDAAQMKDRAFYAPYMVLVPPKKIAVITILELLKLNSTGGIVDGMRTARAVISVGKALELEYKSQNLVEAENRSLSKRLTTNQWKKVLRARKDYSKANPSSNTEWDYPVYAKLGSVLISLLMHVAKVTVKGTDPVTGDKIKSLQPAFHHTYQFLQGQRLGVLKVHKSLVRQLAGNALTNAVQPQLLPMLVPPRPWVAYNDGGYLFSQNNIIRIKDSAETNAYLKAASDLGNLDPLYEGLNVLGNTSWTINHEVFDVISHFWNTGEKFLDIPPIVEDPDLPTAPPMNAEPLEKTEYQRRLRQVMNDAASARSQRCDTNYKLEIARAFLGEKLYFAHNVDFRGRAYPLSPHFNHLGNDMTRSLFLFWEGKKVGAKGLEWLKIHLANLYGVDKAPLHERVQFVEDNMQHIIESAKNPFDPKAWWRTAEKPWQLLGVCFELKRAYDLDDPTELVSHIPIHQDGTCNGLQHYAALGGDFEGARQVNLIPADRPQDVYKFVANLVQKRVDAEAQAGNEYALFLQDKITRKVVKQTVMTNVYGVTFVGAVAQIQKQIDHHFSDEDSSKVGDYARYLTSQVFASMRELFEGAHLIQDWLGESAKRISKSVRTDLDENVVKDASKPSHMSSVIWTSPLGLPCVQPYRVSKRQIIATNLQDIVISDPFGASQVDARKQQSAFPPNFVHSLDATHMLMTARACGNRDMSFASVHDSYWTHACDVDTMNFEIRLQFVALHENNLIVKLRDEFEKRYKGFLQVITIPGDHEVALKIKSVRRSIVKDIGRALTVADEVFMEKKRQHLLESDDPEMVDAGRQMVTTVSVTEGYDMNDLAVTAAASKATQVLAPLTFPNIPPKGELDVKVVMDSPYFFS